ncbi:MAG: imidazole glycerol phosphate synthase subunit HisH [Alphaproteobacteria bacterium]
MNVAIIDYGSGNLRSAAKAFERAGAERGDAGEVRVTDRADDLDWASHIVLPGVGAFADCKAGLAALSGMIEALNRNAIGAGKPFLGICVGMQLMASRGLEHGVHEGLGWIAGEVRALEPDDPALKIPHMGWNDLKVAANGHTLTGGLETGTDVYFDHGYHLVCEDPGDRIASVDYGGAVTAIVGRGNLLGTQFHPEKSQSAGLSLIASFLQWRAEPA